MGDKSNLILVGLKTCKWYYFWNIRAICSLHSAAQNNMLSGLKVWYDVVNTGYIATWQWIVCYVKVNQWHERAIVYKLHKYKHVIQTKSSLTKTFYNNVRT